MQLYLINRNPENACYQLLLAAAKERNLEVVTINSDSYTLQIGQTMPDGILYRNTCSKRCALIERLIYTANPGITTLRQPTQLFRSENKLTIQAMLVKAGIPTPKTCFTTDHSAANLQKIAANLGLPMIIKSFSGTCGEGVALVNSIKSLLSVTDLLRSQGVDFFYQEYVTATCGRSVRVIVLGEEVVVAYELTSVQNSPDFRSNYARGFSERQQIKLSTEDKAIAINTIRTRGFEFGGVDLLFGTDGFLVTELNFPCNFANAQNFTGMDIAGQMLDFLLAKHAAKHA